MRDTSGDVRWWTWAGLRANLTLRSTLSSVVDPSQRVDDAPLWLRDDVTPAAWDAELNDVHERLCLPEVDPKALAGLKFNAALPDHLAERTLAARLADLHGARGVLRGPHRFTVT